MEIVYGVGLLLFFSLSQLIYKWLEESHLLWPLIGIVILILAGLTYERLQNMPVKPHPSDDMGEGITRGQYDACMREQYRTNTYMYCRP